jgi:hypothetical protein
MPARATAAVRWCRRSPGADGHVEVGIVSWSIGCALPNMYNAYTRVSAYFDWLVLQILREDDPVWTQTSVRVVTDIIRAADLALTADEIRMVAAVSNLLPNADAAKELIAGLRNHKRRDLLFKAMAKFHKLQGIKAHASDGDHDVVVLNDGSVLAVDYLPGNESGRYDPAAEAVTDAVAVGAWQGRSYALKRDGKLIAWDSISERRRRMSEGHSCHPDC